MEKNLVGLKWQKCCFHVHTPASNDYEGDKHIQPKEFLRKAIESGIDVIGITDHHSFEWIEALMVARDELTQESGKKLLIFPGTEIYTNDSVHVLVFLNQMQNMMI